MDGDVRDAVDRAASGGGVLAEAVVVVNRMVALGWVDKRPGADARSRALHLTRAGKSAARAILRARNQALRDLVGRLTARQREQLSGIAESLLRPLPSTERDLARLCRLCDRSCCARCPVHEGLTGGHLGTQTRISVPQPGRD